MKVFRNFDSRFVPNADTAYFSKSVLDDNAGNASVFGLIAYGFDPSTIRKLLSLMRLKLVQRLTNLDLLVAIFGASFSKTFHVEPSHPATRYGAIHGSQQIVHFLHV